MSRGDNPTGQLPGTGIPSGSDSGLHGTSRRRDSSVPERSRLRTSESGASAGGSRPSLLRSFGGSFWNFHRQKFEPTLSKEAHDL